jgi:hypothetical protein
MMTGYPMTSQIFLAQGNAAASVGGIWEFIVLVILVVFLILVATEGSKGGNDE